MNTTLIGRIGLLRELRLLLFLDATHALLVKLRVLDLDLLAAAFGVSASSSPTNSYLSLVKGKKKRHRRPNICVSRIRNVWDCRGLT